MFLWLFWMPLTDPHSCISSWQWVFSCLSVFICRFGNSVPPFLSQIIRVLMWCLTPIMIWTSIIKTDISVWVIKVWIWTKSFHPFWLVHMFIWRIVFCDKLSGCCFSLACLTTALIKLGQPSDSTKYVNFSTYDNLSSFISEKVLQFW